MLLPPLLRRLSPIASTQPSASRHGDAICHATCLFMLQFTDLLRRLPDAATILRALMIRPTKATCRLRYNILR